LIESEITESTKQKKLGEEFSLFNFAWYSWHFMTQVPPCMQLTEAECRIAWHRDMLNPAIEKTKRQYLNRKTGEYEEQDALYVDIRTVATKEQIAAEKRLSSVQVVRNNASQKAIENSKAAAINFLSMSADDEFFAVAWPGFLIFDQ